jgi:hypothetical protein
MRILLMLFVLFFSFKTFAEIKDKELLNAYNEGCLSEDPGPITVGEQFLVCGCLTSEVSKQYTVDEIMEDDDYVEKEKFNKIMDFCISLILDIK